jgi:hypothetical protein
VQNCGWNYADASAVAQGWMNSTSHRQNLLSPSKPVRYRVWSRAILDTQCPVDHVVPSPSSRDAVKAVTGDHPKR